MQNYLNRITSIKMIIGSQNLSKSAYLESVENLTVIENTGGGDCFFIAVADAINYYNYYNQDKRIIIGMYGKETNLFTQLVLRGIVFNYIINWTGLDDYLTNVVPYTVDDLNNKFATQLNAIKAELRAAGSSDYISPENYLRIANNIYSENENFLVKLPKSVPINISNYESPFTILLKTEIKGYILSNNYWANQIAILAISIKLKLNIVPIGKGKNNNLRTILNIPFANFSTNNDDWNKYLFLYYNDSHYELITFNSATKIPNYVDGVRKGDKINLSKTTILERTPASNLSCPLYLLFLIFGSVYSTITGVDDKNNFTFYRDLMIEFENSMTTPTNNNKKFNDIFIEYFPDNKINLLPPPPPPPSSSASAIPPPPPYSPLPPPHIGGPSTAVAPLDPASAARALKLFKRNASKTYRPKKSVRFSPSVSKKGGAYPNNTYYRPNYYNPNYYNPNYKPLVLDDNKTNLSYIIDVYMELHPGTTMSEEERKDLKCNSKWNAIRKSYADFVGKPYVIPPLYKKYNNNTLKVSNNPNINKNNITRKQKQ